MDRPHSSRSQFNKRAPKSGPSPLFRSITSEKDLPKMPPKKKTSSSDPSSSLGLVRRPIATNSRVRQEESVKREMYLSFVANSLQQKLIGKTESYDELVSQFNLSQQSPVDTAQIRQWLIALSHVVSRLERSHSSLVESIVGLPWTTLDNPTVKAYTVFIGMLLSAKPEYLSLVLEKFAQGLTYQSSSQTLSMPSTSDTLPLTRRTISDRLHYLLQHLLTLIPTLPRTLQPFLIKYFPHKRQNQLAQVTYIKNLLKVSSYCPELGEKILSVIVDRAIQIDVEIQIELEELEDQAVETSSETFNVDPFDIALGQEPSSSSSSGESDSDSDENDNEADTFSDISSDAGDVDVDFDDSNAKHQDVPMDIKHISEMVKKLDAILFLLFEHFEETRVRCGAVQSHDRIKRPSTLSELPPLPPLDMPFMSGLSTPSTPTLGTPYSQTPTPDPFGIYSAFIPPTPPIPHTSSTPILSSRSTPANTASASTSKPSKSSRQTLRNQFHSLLAIFDRTILRTFKSRYTQFLLFWYASLDPEFSDIVMGMLVERALMGSTPTPMPTIPNDETVDGGDPITQKQHHIMTPEVTRSAAASYIGSFVSRATFVDREGTTSVMGVLCEYLQAHLDGVEEVVKAGGAKDVVGGSQHMVFYAVVQAVFLIFCFRWRDLVGSPEEDGEDVFSASFDPTAGPLSSSDDNPLQPSSWIPALSILKRCVLSVLNPLRVCSPNVVLQFTRVANATGFMYCYPILANELRKGTSPATTSSQRAGTEDATNKPAAQTKLNPTLSTYAELNTFFPFDPYRLPRSGTFVEGVYREWESVAIDGDEDDDDDDEDEEEEEDQLADDEQAEDRTSHLAIPIRKKTTGDEVDGELGASLGVMSISPQSHVQPMGNVGVAMSLG